MPRNALWEGKRSIRLHGLKIEHDLKSRETAAAAVEKGTQMPDAKTLRDLLRIRESSRQTLGGIEHLGTALGLKNGNGPPSVMIFVPRKIHEKWLPAGAVLPETLEGPDDLSCPTDVVGVDDLENLVPPRPVSGANLELRDELRGWSPTLGPGSQLAAFGRYGDSWLGTLAALARDPETGALGFITNQHVAGYVGNVLKFPDIDTRPVAIVRKQRDFIRDETRFPPDVADTPHAYYRVDCAFAELLCDLDEAQDLDPRVAMVVKKKVKEREKEVIVRRRLGKPLTFDLDSMAPVGQKVIGVGRTRSSQRGTIYAAAYEFSSAWLEDVWQERDSEARWIQEREYTDYVIVGEEHRQFSDPGDSGKLIVTDDRKCRPVALLWGGAPLRLRGGRQIEDWSFAIDIGTVLDQLGVEIVSKL